MTDSEKLDAIAALLPGMAADLKAATVEVKALSGKVDSLAADLKATREAVEVVAVEQARIRDDMAVFGRRITRVEHAQADTWAAIDRLRPQH